MAAGAASLLWQAGITWPRPEAAAGRAMAAAASRFAARLGPLGGDLFAAAHDGRLRDVDDLLRRGAVVDLTFPSSRGGIFRGETPLAVAARRGHTDVAVRLLEAGADPDAGDGTRALDWAAERGDATLCRALIAARADVSRGSNDSSPLQHALSGRSPDVVRQLLDAGARLPPASRCEMLANMLRAQGAADLASRVTPPAPEWWRPPLRGAWSARPRRSSTCSTCDTSRGSPSCRRSAGRARTGCTR
jgi:hypothetical protein